MKELFKGNGWQVTEETAELPDGRKTTRTRVRYADTVHVLAVTSSGKLLVLREYRPFYKTYIWMLPSGHVDKETDRTVAADRELREETGYRAGSLKYLWSMNATEKMDSTNHVYLAKDLTHDPLPQDADELIEVHELSAEEAYKNISHSERVHLASAYSVLRFLHEQSSTGNNM